MGEGGGPVDAPPSAPSVRRRVLVSRVQAIGVPFLLLLPVLALFGVFDTVRAERVVWAGDLSVVVRWPSRIRETQSEQAEVELRNAGEGTVSARVAFEGPWLDAFRDVRIDPGAHEARTVALEDIAPGETRRVRVQLRAEKPGRHTGMVHVLREPGDRVAAVPVATLVLP
jgi:hypothetical protein